MTTAAAHVTSGAQSGGSDALSETLRRMKDAQRKNGSPTFEQRIASLDKLERAIATRKEAIAQAIARDFGNRSKHETWITDVFLTLSAIKHTKAHLRDWMEPQDRETSWAFLPASSQVISQPLGVIGIISPWNYPLQLALSPLVAALSAGNRAMIKPSELVPETSALLRDLVQATFAEDEVAVITGGAEVGEAFAKLPFDHLLFTGSTRVGRLVMRAASENLVPVTLELGGKSPAIVGEDASARKAAEAVIAGKLLNCGQTCVAPDYVMMPAAARESFVESCRAAVAKLYPTLAQNPDYTSIIDERSYRRLQGYVEDAKRLGATVVELNPAGEVLDAASRKMAPLLVLDPTEEMLVLKEEIFGPILPIKTYAKLDDAIAYVNDHPRPLALYYFGRGRAAIDRVVSETMSGGVSLNAAMLHAAQEDLPFGGVGPSGMGQYGAREGFETFSKKKAVFRQSRINGSSLLRPPYGKLLERVLKVLLS